jgi:hypothetical protein
LSEKNCAPLKNKVLFNPGFLDKKVFCDKNQNIGDDGWGKKAVKKPGKPRHSGRLPEKNCPLINL